MRDSQGKHIGDNFQCECGFRGELDDMDVLCDRIDSESDMDKFNFTLLCPQCGTDEIGAFDDEQGEE